MKVMRVMRVMRVVRVMRFKLMKFHASTPVVQATITNRNQMIFKNLGVKRSRFGIRLYLRGGIEIN